MKRGLKLILLILIISTIPQLSSAACTDSDGGDIRTKLGIASNESVTIADTCESIRTVNEAVCDDGSAIELLAQECPVETRCYNGRCLYFENAPCEDTDGGIEYSEYGIVTYNDDTILRDMCDPDSALLTEFYCQGGIPWSVKYVCDSLRCSNGACVDNEEDLGAEIPPDEAGFPCNADNIFWTDGYNHNIEESGIGLPVYGFVSGDGCDGAYFHLNVIDASDDSLVEDLGELNFGFDGDSLYWYNISSWVPSSEGKYYLKATVYGAGYSYEIDNSDNPIVVSGDCEPNPLPEGLECGNDPITGEPLTPGNDFDCDGVDDCRDQWLYNYGGEVDPLDGIPLGMSGCLGFWDCTNAQWSQCMKNSEGRLTRTRDITRCTLPSGSSCPIAPSNEKSCLKEQPFPVFGWLNSLTVIFMLMGYYLVRKKNL